MLVDFGKANYLQKAILQPEKVKQVVENSLRWNYSYNGNSF